MNAKLRLGPLPSAETIKLTITVPVGLKIQLDRYAALHSETWGETVLGRRSHPAHAHAVHFARQGVQGGDAARVLADYVTASPRSAVTAEYLDVEWLGGQPPPGTHASANVRIRPIASSKGGITLYTIAAAALRSC